MAQGRKCVTVTRRLWYQFPLGGIDYYLLLFSFCSLWYLDKSSALNSAIKHAMPQKFGGKWGTKCLTLGLLLSTLLYAGYSVKKKYM